MLRLATFIVLSGVLAYVSRASLPVPRSHGFWRFWAWECILGLFFLNFISIRQWFGDPWSVRQMASWTLLFGSIVPAGWGAHALWHHGRRDHRRTDDTPLIGIEKTTRLVTTGAFRHIRHPLYSSLLLLAWGVFLKHPTWGAGALALSASAFLLATAGVEEVENVRYFGDAYRTYMQRTKRFLPFLL